MQLRFIALLILVATYATTISAAPKTHKVSITYAYNATGNESPEQAKRTALERAKIEAIAEKFGTVVSQTNQSVISAENEHSTSRFHSVSANDVRGEWIETIGEPEYKIEYIDNMLRIEVKLEGKVREITPNGIDFIARTLKNGTELKYEATDFKSGDDLYLYFKTPVRGYVSSFLLDEQAGECYCLLPYKEQDGMPLQVKPNKDYYFFSEKMAEEDARGKVDEYTLTAESDIEYNTLYIIFSTEEFARPTANAHIDELIPAATRHADFLKWLSRLRSKSNKINCVTIPLTITKQPQY